MGHDMLLHGAVLIVLFFLASETGRTAMPLSLTSPGFSHGGEIPKRYTCEGSDVSPPLAWSGYLNEPRAWFWWLMIPTRQIRGLPE